MSQRSINFPRSTSSVGTKKPVLRRGLGFVIIISFLACASEEDAATGQETVHIDLTKSDVLNHFQGSKRKQVLERYLAASAGWHVRLWKGNRVAYQRKRTEGEWSSSMNMFFLDNPKRIPRETYTAVVHDLQYSIVLHLEKEQPTKRFLDIFWGDPVDEGRAGSEGIDLWLTMPNFNRVKFESCLWVRGKGVGLEIFEQHPSKERKYTKKFLKDVCSELEELQDLQDDANVNGLLPMGSLKKGKASTLEIEDGVQKGIYEATGYVNPGKQGMIYLKVYDEATGKRLSKKETSEKVEYPGWSGDPGEKYYYRFGFFIGEGGWSKPYPARFELWFKPQDGSPEKKLYNVERMIYGWEH
jgi:hypothetical protein